jgi:hypothetical protein
MYGGLLAAVAFVGMRIVGTTSQQPRYVTALNTDLAVAGQAPDWHGCPSVGACCDHCANKSDFFVFQESGQCYCKAPPFTRQPCLHNIAGSCSGKPLPPCTAPECSASSRIGPAQVRFSVEGGGSKAIVCAAAATTTAAAPILRAQMHEAGPPWSSTLNTPTQQWYQGGTQKPQVIELPAPVAINATCLSVDGGTVTVDGAGMLYTSRDNGSTWDSGTTAEYYQAVAVAFGLRPYINEMNGTLLLAADPALIAGLQQASAADHAAVSVTLKLPFATTPSAQTVSWRAERLLQRSETVLSFSLASLPATVNQDVTIEISLPHGRTIRKLKRLMRAPPLPSGSFVQAVQVDHSTRSLTVDSRPFNGVGWYATSTLPDSDHTVLSRPALSHPAPPGPSLLCPALSLVVPVPTGSCA